MRTVKTEEKQALRRDIIATFRTKKHDIWRMPGAIRGMWPAGVNVAVHTSERHMALSAKECTKSRVSGGSLVSNRILEGGFVLMW